MMWKNEGDDRPGQDADQRHLDRRHRGQDAFNDLKEAVGRGDWRQAAWDIGHKNRDQNSPPSKDIGDVPNRAIRNINLMDELADDAGQPPLFP
jgi:hypothetical protein